MNLSETIIPKSDQLNADDLISGALTIKVTAIKGSNEPQQPAPVPSAPMGGDDEDPPF